MISLLQISAIESRRAAWSRTEVFPKAFLKELESNLPSNPKCSRSCTELMLVEQCAIDSDSSGKTSTRDSCPEKLWLSRFDLISPFTRLEWNFQPVYWRAETLSTKHMEFDRHVCWGNYGCRAGLARIQDALRRKMYRKREFETRRNQRSKLTIDSIVGTEFTTSSHFVVCIPVDVCLYQGTFLC